MRHVPWHVKGVRLAAREPTGDAARRSGLSVTAAFAMIRKEIQDLRRQTSRFQAEPGALEQQLHQLAAQIGALQGATGSGTPGQEAFLKQLNALLAQNLTALQHEVAATAATAIGGPAESIRRDVASLKEIQASVDRRTQDTFEAVYGTIERIVDRLAAIEDEMRERASASQADAPAVKPPREPPPSDEAGMFGTLSVGPLSAPESPAGGTMPALPSVTDDAERTASLLRQPAIVPAVGVNSVAAAAGREPVRADAPDVPPPQAAAAAGMGLVAAAQRAARSLTGRTTVPTVPAAALMRTTLGPIRPRRKAGVIGLAAALLTLFALMLTLDFFRTPGAPADPIPVRIATVVPEAGQAGDEPARAATPSSDQPPAQDDARQDAQQEPAQESVAMPPPPDGSVRARPPSETSMMAAAAETGDSAPWDAETLMRNVLLPAPVGRDPWPQAGPLSGTDLPPILPTTIGGKALLAAAQAGDAGAAYEIASRYAQGRNTPQDFAKAAVWLQRAARAGIAPAQFRLGGMYEKGLGVRKDIDAARRSYTAAAMEGHAKAMHNLAVLYTRGIHGPPDYTTAAEWFRKAAAYGTVDSQYNLGILYARGSGVERDLVESYKWFALAAKAGDKDAAHKRDEVAKGLDATQLETAKASAEGFVAMLPPDEATATRAPVGGWDQLAAAATPKAKPSARAERSPGK